MLFFKHDVVFSVIFQMFEREATNCSKLYMYLSVLYIVIYILSAAATSSTLCNRH